MDARARMLRLLSLLQSGRRWLADDLAAELGTTTRTLRRDVGFLRDEGYPVESARGPGGHYRLSGGSALPPLVLDDEEALAAVLGLRLAVSGGTGLDVDGRAADAALGKLRRMLPTRLRPRADAIITAVETSPQDRPLPSAGLVQNLATAIHRHRLVTFAYARRGETRIRSVEPYRLVSISTGWYLLAWDRGRADWRVFRLDRIIGDPASGATFRPRALPSDDAAGYLVERFAAPAVLRVVLTLNVSAERAAALLHRVDGPIEAIDAGHSRYTARVDSYEWLAMVLVVSELTFTVEDPPGFADFLDAAARRLGDGAAPLRTSA